MAVRSKLGRWRIGYKGTACPRCKAFMRHEDLKTGSQRCGTCGGTFEAVRFDPVDPIISVPSLEAIGRQAEAPCTRHAKNLAVASCSRCGQFMCSLCRIDAEGKAYCPPCFERLSNEGSIPGGATRVRNYAGLASACLVGTWLFLFAAPLTGPVGIYYCVKGVKDKKSRNERDGIARLYFLLVLNLLMALGGVIMLAGILGAFATAKGR